MYHAIVFLPLLGAIIAALIALAGARARPPGGPPGIGAENHAHGPVDESHARVAPAPHGAHAVLDASHSVPEALEPPAAGSRSAELVTTVFLFAAMLLSWLAFADVGFGHHDSRVTLFPWIISGELKVDWALRIDTLTAVMFVVVTTISAFVHLYSIGYMEEDPHRPRFFSYLSLFTFAMLMLVTADNLMQLFFGDRKSTRVNSSHRCISYAVFCLKKTKRHPSKRLAVLVAVTPVGPAPDVIADDYRPASAQHASHAYNGIDLPFDVPVLSHSTLDL